MKVICLDHDEMIPLSKNPVSGAIKHLHWQLFETSAKPTAANVWCGRSAKSIHSQHQKLYSMLVSLYEYVSTYFQIILNAKVCFIRTRLCTELDIIFSSYSNILAGNLKENIPSSFVVDSRWMTANPSLFNHLKFK